MVDGRTYPLDAVMRKVKDERKRALRLRDSIVRAIDHLEAWDEKREGAQGYYGSLRGLAKMTGFTQEKVAQLLEAGRAGITYYAALEAFRAAGCDVAEEADYASRGRRR